MNVLTATRRPDAPVSAEPDPKGTKLLAQAHELYHREPFALPLLRLSLDGLQSDTDLLAAVLASALPDKLALGAALDSVKHVLQTDAKASAATLRDIAVTTSKNFEPGSEIATLLFSRGIHATLAHRVAHALWRSGRHEVSLAVKTIFGRAFSTDIHPGAVFGSGIWLDHGVGFVVGETAVIEDEVSIWHRVTLGSILKTSGQQRHPQIRRGATICAGAIVLGNVEVGEGSVIAAGAVVLTDVAPFSTLAGIPARLKQRSDESFLGI